MPLETPIAFCIFNRPEVTQRVFAAIAEAKPKRLLIIGDGPREDRPGEAELVEQTRSVVERIDWACEVQTNFSQQNLGCGKRIATGLTWAFEQSEELIILEDDCLPHPSFFTYCESLLSRFRDDERIMMISGDNFQPHRRTDKSYYFSHWPHIWGWASWRRAWNHFDLEIESWPDAKSNGQLDASFIAQDEQAFWSDVFDQIRLGKIDTWDFSWAYACWKNNALSVLPETNLVSNLGFGDSATHTLDPMSRLANLPVSAIGNLKHPDAIIRNLEADEYTWRNIISPPVEPTPQARKKKWYRRLFRKSA